MRGLRIFTGAVSEGRRNGGMEGWRDGGSGVMR